MLWWQTELVWNVNQNKINILTSKTLNPWQETIILPRWAVITLVPESACSCASSSHQQTACLSIELSHFLALSGERFFACVWKHVVCPVCLQEKSHRLHWLAFSTEWMSMCPFKQVTALRFSSWCEWRDSTSATRSFSIMSSRMFFIFFIWVATFCASLEDLSLILRNIDFGHLEEETAVNNANS